MARREPRLTPDLRNASRFGDFSQFRTAHRDNLEQNDLFRRWQERLFNIAEREGRHFGLRVDDSMTAWDVWYHQIVQPMRKEMWTAWEAWHNLPEKFHTAAAQQRQRQEVVPCLHVAAAADTTHLMDVGSEAPSVSPTVAHAPLPASAVPATAPPRPTTDPHGKPSPRIIRTGNSTVPLAMGSVKGINSDNTISLDGDSWSI